MKNVCILFIAMFFFCGAAHATIWYVHPDSALNSIQAGLDSCTDNDTVLVGPGIYYENVIWPNTQGIDLISELGQDSTIIDGSHAGTVISVSATDTTTIIRGFTIQNGHGPWDGVGGIYCAGAPVIMENLITDNFAFGQAGSGGIGYGSPIILYNTITNNRGYVGGINTWDNYNNDTIIVIGNTITYNEGYGYSRPGISAVCCRFAVLKHNFISCNSGNVSGAVCCDYATIDSCEISNNQVCGIWPYSGVNMTINHCNIFGNGYGVRNTHNASVGAENNWWGHATGPYHSILNPGGLGDSVSDYVDFDPWLSSPVGVAEQPIVEPLLEKVSITATIFRGPLQLVEGMRCRVFDITGRVVAPDKIKPGIYFIEIDGVVTRKVVKVR